MIDFDRLADDLLHRAEYLVSTWLPDGKRKGREWVARNPRRSDGRPGSFSINTVTGVWKDFATGDGGADLISLYAYLQGIGQADAARELSDTKLPEPKKRPAPKHGEWIPTGAPGPHDATPEDMAWPARGKIARWWCVRDSQNRPLYYDVRFEREKNGKVSKDVLPMCWCRHSVSGAEGWKYKAFPAPRPLYGHVAVEISDSSAPVIVVEGMKTAEGLSHQVGDRYPVVTWPGGSSAVAMADWSPLAKHRVAIWPDADEPGFSAAIKISEILEKIGCTVSVIVPPDDVPSGWDAADMVEGGASRGEILSLMQSRMMPIEEFRSLNTEKPAPTPPPDDDDIPPWVLEDISGDDASPSEPADVGEKPEPFRVLGHDHEKYYYLPRDKGQVVCLRLSSHTKPHLLSLAPITWWEDSHGGQRGVAWTAAVDSLIRGAHRAGPFSPARIRGRGAWRDGTHIVVHHGDYLTVDGVRTDPVDFHGEYIYERRERLRLDGVEPAPASLGREIIELFRMFAWRQDVHGVMAAGWAFLAPLCGALYWRPHIWITGEAGSGKTWVRDNAIAPFVRGYGIVVQGSTTAAGIRQALGGDALPVLVDEAEPDGARGAARIAEVLEFMRQSSMSGESTILRGSASGDVMTYSPASMWCLSSVVTSIRQQADQGRISVLELLRYTQEIAEKKGRSLREQHRVTADLCARLFTPENCRALRARAVQRLPYILEIIDVFREAAADHLGSQRDGDQVGTLLAGAYCLASDGKITPAKARDYIESQSWTDILHIDDREEDHIRLLRHIIQYTIRVPTPMDGTLERTVGQLLAIAYDVGYNRTSLTAGIARDTLATYGIMVGSGSEMVAKIHTRHRAIDRMLHDTSWAGAYAPVLRRMPGAREERYPADRRSRCIVVDISGFLPESVRKSEETSTHEKVDYEEEVQW